MLRDVIPAVVRYGGWSGESRLVGSGGVETPVQLTMLAHRDRDHTVTRISVRAHDVSRYKEVERVKNEFISTVSHELRTPLTSIRGSLGLLEGGAMGPLPDKARSMVHIANQNTDRLIRLINDVLDLEKMQAGRLELHRKPLDIRALVDEAVAGLHGMAGAAAVGIDVDGPPDLVAEVDHDRIVQVITNLLSNAVKFSPPGSTVRIEAVSVTEGRTPCVAVSVIDQGPGIPADKLDSIFDRFVQVDSSSTRAKGGSGLGLAIARDIVALHGGTIEVASPSGAGTTFTFRLPIEAAGRAEPAEATPEPPPFSIGEQDVSAGRTARLDPTILGRLEQARASGVRPARRDRIRNR